MNCFRCKSSRVANVTAKCDDRCGVNLSTQEHDGYVPEDVGIGGGDYISFHWCLDCGQIQDKFPLPKTELEYKSEEDPEESDDNE